MLIFLMTVDDFAEESLRFKLDLLFKIWRFVLIKLKRMADVSLDDLIKKDKQKGRMERLKQVPLNPLRNSNPKN